MEVDGDWLEVRCTAEGVLEDLGYRRRQPPAGVERHEGVFSVVLDDDGARTRQLPMLYHGAAQLYADRRVGSLGRRLERALEAIADGRHDAIYMVNACRVDDAYGLYARDVFNRSTFRVHLGRAGVEFAADPYVRLLPSGRFSCRDWGDFDARFVVAGGPFPRDSEEVTDRRGGMTPFMFGVLRMGAVSADELAGLVAFFRRVPVLATESPGALVDRLRGT